MAALSLRTKRGAYFSSIQCLSFAERDKADKVDWQEVYRCEFLKTWKRGDRRSLPILPHPKYRLLPEEERWQLMAPHWDRTKRLSDTPPPPEKSIYLHDPWWPLDCMLGFAHRITSPHGKDSALSETTTATCRKPVLASQPNGVERNSTQKRQRADAIYSLPSERPGLLPDPPFPGLS
ncbi:hypothetical protein PG994_008917 [Apiospora phragmitis]|uniref:Uncharacterized protein n=1 Tax=Apiospora phragmitis TaxID=2905665 RepID=A0ABR1UHT3_9PEZI